MEKETIRNIKQQFFTYRNGIIADKLREAGDTHKIIFGLNLPQITDIAKMQQQSAKLAQYLWDNSSTRESQLIACILYPHDEFSIDTARKWISEVPTIEVADILCHKLLKYTNYAEELVYEYAAKALITEQYISLRLAFNIINIGRSKDVNSIKSMAESKLSSQDKIIRDLSANILNSIE